MAELGYQSKSPAPNGDGDPDKKTSHAHDAPPPAAEANPEEARPGRMGLCGGHSFMAVLRRHWVSFATCCSVFWSFGMCVAFLGPTLRDLGCLTASDMRSISWVFFAQLLCSLLGSIAAGILAKRVNTHLMLLLATTILPVAMFIIPFCRALVGLALVLALMGINMGIIDSLANLRLIQIFQEAVPPFLQTMHACYGLGAFVSPMIAEPFILNEDCSRFVVNHSIFGHHGHLFLNATFTSSDLHEAQERSRVKYAFWIMGTIQLPVPILVLLLFLKKRSDDRTSGQSIGVVTTTSSAVIPQQRNAYQDIDQSKGQTPFWQTAPQYQHQNLSKMFGSSVAQIIGITAFTGFIAFLYDGLQSGYGAYVFYYGIKSVADMSKTEGAYLNACFWGAFALGRIGSIFLATWLTPAFMLLGNIVGCTGSMILMLSLRHDHIALYMGSLFFGIFLSSVTPTALSLAEQFIDVTPSVTTFIVVVAALGEMAFPVILGNMFASLGPVSFLDFCLGACVLSVVVYCALWYIGRQTPKSKGGRNRSFVWCCQPRRATSEDQLVGCTQHVKYYSRMSESDSSIEMSTKQTD